MNMYDAHGYAVTALRELDAVEERLAACLKQWRDKPMIFGSQGVLHARRGHKEMALQCVHKALDSPIRSAIRTTLIMKSPASMARWGTALGDNDRAMAWLERRVDAAFPCWPFFRIDPHLELAAGFAGIPAAHRGSRAQLYSSEDPETLERRPQRHSCLSSTHGVREFYRARSGNNGRNNCALKLNIINRLS